ncbi:MAG: ComF family protein [Oscillospiraceae bacterium]
MNFKTLYDKLLFVLFTKKCKYCGSIIPEKLEICDDCQKNLPRILPPICHLCGHSKEDCKCKNKKHEYDAIVAPFYYDKAIKIAIHRFKFGKKLNIGKTLAEDMAQAVLREYSELKFDLIAFIPMTKKEEKKRSFNQSEILANELSEIINVPATKVLVKIYETKTQHTLSEKDRKGNVFGVFDISEKADLAGMTILLVDDIKTTGTTLSECAKMLNLSGAEAVYAVTAAITLKGEKK